MVAEETKQWRQRESREVQIIMEVVGREEAMETGSGKVGRMDAVEGVDANRARVVVEFALDLGNDLLAVCVFPHAPVRTSASASLLLSSQPMSSQRTKTGRIPCRPRPSRE